AHTRDLTLATACILQLEAPLADKVFQVLLPNVLLGQLDQSVDLHLLFANLLTQLVNAFLGQRPDSHAQQIVVGVGGNFDVCRVIFFLFLNRRLCFASLDRLRDLGEGLESTSLQLTDEDSLLLLGNNQVTID